MTHAQIIHISVSPTYRLRTPDGGYVYMDWHRFCGPTFFKDRYCNRPIEDWWDYPEICEALDWFTGRGEVA